MLIPKRSHHTDNLLNPNKACTEEKGTPLSVRIALGRPYSLKTRSNTVIAYCSLVVVNPSHASK